MDKGTSLTAGFNRSQMALLNFLVWKTQPDLNNFSQVNSLVHDVKEYTLYKNSLKSVKVTGLIEESPIE